MAIQDSGSKGTQSGGRIAGKVQLAVLAVAISGVLYLGRAPEPVAYVPDSISGDDSPSPSVVVVKPEPTDRILPVELIGNVVLDQTAPPNAPSVGFASLGIRHVTLGSAMLAAMSSSGLDATAADFSPVQLLDRGAEAKPGADPVGVQMPSGLKLSELEGGLDASKFVQAEGEHAPDWLVTDSFWSGIDAESIEWVASIDAGIPFNTGSALRTDILQVHARISEDALKLLESVIGRTATVLADGGNYVAEVEGVSSVVAAEGWPAKVMLNFIDSDSELPSHGALAAVRIHGPELNGVYMLPAAAFYDQDRVWIVSDDKLTLVETEIIARLDGSAIVSAFDVADGVVVSQLLAPWEGLGVKIANAGW